MKKGLTFLPAVLFFALLFQGCKKEDALKNESGQVVVQGTFTLKIQAKHHYWGVPYLPVYLKKNSTTWPGTDSTKYEFSTITDNNGNCQFTHLFPGSYYVYAHGLDAVFGTPVIGYSPAVLNWTTAPNNELDFTLNVSE